MFEKVRDMLAKQLNLSPEKITLESDVVKGYRECKNGKRYRRYDR